VTHRAQSGQALLVTLAFTASLTCAFLLVFNVGQLVNDKIKLTSAADAAAYSAALWEARALNYQAYLNRAIVANEVAIAQLVSLRSWSRYVGTATTNVATVAQFFPPAAAPLRSIARAWQGVDTALQRGLPPTESALSAWNVGVLTRAQSLAHQQAAIVAADLVTAVAKENEPRAEVNAATRILQARNGAIWQNRFTDKYQRGAGDLRRYTSLLMDSRDGFTRSRRNDLPVQLPLVSLPRRGGTDLLGEYSWRAIDTMSLHLDLLFTSLEIPIGYGAAEQRGIHGGSLRRNPVGSRRARRQMIPLQSYQGVPEIRDVVRPAQTDPRTLVYSVALQVPAAAVPTTDRLLSSSLLTPQLAADALHALGSAELYFQRPSARRDGRVEYPSLFNPYWQARLVDTPTVDRVVTSTQRGLTVDPFVALP
jgi:hypothetical protein